jgi:hypothetical protein
VPGKRRLPATLALAALSVCTALAAPAWADGQLAVKSKPHGAAVYVDGRPVGTTPLVVNVPAGTHQVQVHKQGYTDRVTQVKVVDALTTRAVLALERQDRGELRVSARPAGAQIYVDGRYAGPAPLYLRNLSPGSHRVVAVRDGYVRSVESVQVFAGLTSTSFHALTLLPPAEPVRVAEQPKPVPEVKREAAPEPVREPQREPVREPVREQAPPARRVEASAPKPMPVARAEQAPKPVPVIPAAERPEPNLTMPSVSLPELPQVSLPAMPMPSRRELAFLGGMALLLGALGRYYFRKLKTGKPDAPVLFPARPARGPLPSVDATTAEAATAFRRGHLESAHVALWEAVQTGAGSAWHYYHLGLIAHQGGRPAEAENAYRTALQLAPELVEPGYNLGVMLTETEQAPQAVMAYRKHLDAHPEDVDALFNLGHVYLNLGMHQQAWVHWTAARKLAPKDVQLRANVKFLHRLLRVQRKMGQRLTQPA